MKIVSWNLENFSQNMLLKPMSPAVGVDGYGATVLEFIVKVVMADAVWIHVNPTVAPADLFLLIELDSAGPKGGPLGGSAQNCLATIVNAMNLVPPGYTYAFLGLQVATGEGVGLIYNVARLTPVMQMVLRDYQGTYLTRCTPYLARFTVNATGAFLNVVGIHADPTQGGGAARFKTPIKYCRSLATCRDLVPLPPALPQPCLMAGDFNCCPDDEWIVGAEHRQPFTPGLAAYTPVLPGRTLTSVRNNVNYGKAGQEMYLREAYDNVLHTPNLPPFSGAALDLIGNLDASSMGAWFVEDSLENFRLVTNHLPVVAC